LEGERVDGMNAHKKRYYQMMANEAKCVRELQIEIEGKMIDHDYDTAIERCSDMMRSLQTMKRIRAEKQLVDLLHSIAKNVMGRPGA